MIVSVEKREHEIMLSKNKADLEFYVAIPSGNYKVPPFCTCCMKPTDNKEKVVGTIVKKGLISKKTQRLIMYFPVCQECLEHRKSLVHKRKIWLCLTLAVSLLSFCFALIIGLQYEYAFLLNLGIVVIALLAIGKGLKVVELDPEHSTHENGVQVAAVNPKENLVFFRFSNWCYAKIFAVANDSELKEHPYRNRMGDSQLIKVISKPKRFAGIIIAISFVVTIFVRGFLSMNS